jgi:regulator of ribonuclease activity A
MNKSFSTPDLYDAYGDCCSSCETQFRQYGGRRNFCGRIRTVKCLDDNVLVRAALETQVKGDVLIVDGGGSLRCALMGDVLAELGARHGWSGAVILGAVRDTPALAALQFGVKALGSNPKKSSKSGAGARGVEVSFGGITFVPGHWIYCDDDGILVAAEELAIAPLAEDQSRSLVG